MLNTIKSIVFPSGLFGWHPQTFLDWCVMSVRGECSYSACVSTDKQIFQLSCHGLGISLSHILLSWEAVEK